MRYPFAVLSILFLANAAILASPAKVCVRNYPADAEVSPCRRFPDAYTYVIPWKPGLADDSQVCTRIYGDTYCDVSPKEYVRIPTVDGRTICALDFNQPPVSDFCVTIPDFYHWVMGLPQ